MKSLATLTGLACLLTACEPYATPSPELEPPGNLAARCPDLIPLEKGADFGDLLRYSVDTTLEYRQCRAKREGLIAWLRSTRG